MHIAVRRREILSTLFLMLGVAFIADGRAAEAVSAIAAAADLDHALNEVPERFTKDTGKRLVIAFGSSGYLTTQIRQGAPFEVFLCADEEYALTLAKDGKTDGEGTLYEVGRIGLFASKNSPLKVDGNLSDLSAALKDGLVQKFAIANLDHAPYGRAARAAVQHARLWEAVEPKLVLGESVSQAAHLAASGSAQGGIIPFSLASAPSVAEYRSFALIPKTWHPQLRQRRCC